MTTATGCPSLLNGAHYGWCNSCGEEALSFTECCEDGEVVAYDDCTCDGEAS